EDLDENTVKEIYAVMAAGVFLTPEVALTPDTDKVLWFGVALADGQLSFKAPGAYIYKVVRQDDSEYIFGFTYDPEMVTGIEHTITFDSKGGSAVEEIKLEKGTVATEPTEPTKEGNEFKGWFTDAAYTTEYDWEEEVTENLTLYAKWEIINYTITYVMNDGIYYFPVFATKDEMKIAFLTDFYAYVNPAETLEVFMHGEGKTSGYAGTWHSVHKAKIYAGPRPSEVNEAYFASSSAYMEKWLPFFDQLNTLVIETNNTQSFWGGTWTGLIRIDEYFRDARYGTDMRIPNEYKEFNSYNINSADITLRRDLVKEGSSFVGWFNNPEFTGEEITSIPQGSTGNITLYAKFNSITDFLVDSSITAEEGTKITVNEIEFIVGVSAFKTLEELAGLFGENVNIYVAAGTYSGDLVINKNGVTLLGNNALISGNAEERNAETILTGKITLAKELEDITISGFKFTGMAQILNTKGTAGTGSVPTINLNGFTFENNIVETALASGNGFIIFEEAGSSYSHNLEFVNNFFTTTDEETTLANVIYIDNNAGLTFTGNVFKDVINGAFYVHDSTKGLAGNTLISENTFENVGNGAILIGWLSALPGTTMGVEISKNEFTNVGGIALKLGSMNNADVFTFINVKENEFTDCDACMWFNRVHAGANYHVNDNVFNTVPEDYYITDAKTAGTPVALDATNNIYKDNGEVITPNPEKFVGSPSL
ncbi:MAG: InlB B-repeat-containing protein, partial [Bacilli bacterium]